jgi:hypothetical protein
VKISHTYLTVLKPEMVKSRLEKFRDDARMPGKPKFKGKVQLGRFDLTRTRHSYFAGYGDRVRGTLQQLDDQTEIKITYLPNRKYIFYELGLLIFCLIFMLNPEASVNGEVASQASRIITSITTFLVFSALISLVTFVPIKRTMTELKEVLELEIVDS